MALSKQDFALRLRRARELKGLSQRDAAEQAHVGYRTWQRWEDPGETGAMPYPKQLPVIARVVDVDKSHFAEIAAEDTITAIATIVGENNRLLRQLMGAVAGLEARLELSPQEEALRLAGAEPQPARGNAHASERDTAATPKPDSAGAEGR